MYRGGAECVAWMPAVIAAQMLRTGVIGIGIIGTIGPMRPRP